MPLSSRRMPSSGSWVGVTHLVAMTSNAPPDVDPVAVAGSGHQVLQVVARPVTLRHDPGLAASPPVRYMLKVEGYGHSPS